MAKGSGPDLVLRCTAIQSTGIAGDREVCTAASSSKLWAVSVRECILYYSLQVGVVLLHCDYGGHGYQFATKLEDFATELEEIRVPERRRRQKLGYQRTSHGGTRLRCPNCHCRHKRRRRRNRRRSAWLHPRRHPLAGQQQQQRHRQRPKGARHAGAAGGPGGGPARHGEQGGGAPGPQPHGQGAGHGGQNRPEALHG